MLVYNFNYLLLESTFFSFVVNPPIIANNNPTISVNGKIINEIIDNSIDVAIKSNFKFANEISIELIDTKVTIKDNGYGIPVELNEAGVYIYPCNRLGSG